MGLDFPSQNGRNWGQEAVKKSVLLRSFVVVRIRIVLFAEVMSCW
jgi:hypothetical protein